MKPENMLNGNDIEEKENNRRKMKKRQNEVRFFFKNFQMFRRFYRSLVAFAEIDWHDYAIVQTIEFTTADTTSELPLPMSIQEMENMTLSQKRMAAMIMENTAEEIEAHKAKQAAVESGREVSGTNGETKTDMSVTDEEHQRQQEAERIKELERAKAIQASLATGPMKIRTDYIPKRKFLRSSLSFT